MYIIMQRVLIQRSSVTFGPQKMSETTQITHKELVIFKWHINHSAKYYFDLNHLLEYSGSSENERVG